MHFFSLGFFFFFLTFFLFSQFHPIMKPFQASSGTCDAPGSFCVLLLVSPGCFSPASLALLKPLPPTLELTQPEARPHIWWDAPMLLPVPPEFARPPQLRGKQLPSWGLSSCRKPPPQSCLSPEGRPVTFLALSGSTIFHRTPETLLLGPSDSSQVFPQMTQTPCHP